MATLLDCPNDELEAAGTQGDANAETTVLVVDDSAVARRVVGGIVEMTCGFKAAYAKHGKEAVAYLQENKPAAVVTDLNMPEMDGLELVEAPLPPLGA
jgi:CheY-like chemotaxis protein